MTTLILVLLCLAIAGRELRRTLVPRRDAEGGYESGSRSGAFSCTAGGRTESPTAMMRIAKIADEEGGAALAGGGSLRGRAAGGGSLRGRGGDVIGRGGADTPLGGVSSGARGAGSEEASEPADAVSDGSEGARAPPCPSPSSEAIAGFERRRGMGGGWLSGADAPAAPAAGAANAGGSGSAGAAGILAVSSAE